VSARIRLDQALEARGLLPSRARARDAILRGTVTVNGIVAQKPNQHVASADRIALDDPAAAYVSRAALKLVAGLDAGAIDPAGRICLDLGASTGGFTQVLLERGAARVYAVDVGHDQLHERIKADPRVISLEGVNGRDLTAELIPEPIQLIVSDVSFVSILKVIDPVLALAAPGAEAVILIKPQFEVGRENVGKGGHRHQRGGRSGGNRAGHHPSCRHRLAPALRYRLADRRGRRQPRDRSRFPPQLSRGANRRQ
jgi:23S rRNA (cytidine1920-2'-O)/16S rRNA (cytidine1409-2'-O)-methyltransferase